MKRIPYRQWLIILLPLASFLTPTSSVAETGTPKSINEMESRVAQLRAYYKPYLRSLPEPLTIRSRTPLDGDWVSRYEVEKAENSVRPTTPEWFVETYDDSAWEPTTVPEWRYRRQGGRRPVSCILWYRTTFQAAPAENDERVFLAFEGVDWEAEVWLNGKRLGSHRVYYEPFRFDITGLLKGKNTLAVRVIDGPLYGEPAAYWSLFPLVPAKQARYVRDKSKSVIGHRKGDLLIGSGYGIHREVYLERTGKAYVTDVFARGNLDEGNAKVDVQLNSAHKTQLSLRVEIIPENFEGPPFEFSKRLEASEGDQIVNLSVSMPKAKKWAPDTPYLYRCRVKVLDRNKVLDAKDTLFGYRSFTMVSEKNPTEGLQAGTLLLNGEPIFLRGANIQGPNALWYWGEDQKLMDLMLMLQAANFNAVRSCQYVPYPEVLELQDRLGIMSQVDQGSRYPKLGKHIWPQLVEVASTLPRVCYNHPGVVLISFANETNFDPTELIQAALEVDPDRIMKPISGKPHGGGAKAPTARSLFKLPDALWSNVIEDFHPYWGWYGHLGRMDRWSAVYGDDRLVTAGEYGGEALDSYETMSQHYPDYMSPPAIDSDKLWGQIQIKKGDVKQVVGFRGKIPANLGESIEASQTYQSDLLNQMTKTFRLSPNRIAGYFQFHFVDVLPANWPKSIVSHDLTPKKGYFAMAQINQPLVSIPRVTNRAKAMDVWIANDHNQSFKDYRVRWVVRSGKKKLVEGETNADIPASGAVEVHTADLSSIPEDIEVINISTRLLDSEGAEVSQYTQEFYLAPWRGK